MRKEFEMTDEEYQAIIDASKPVPYMVFGGVEPGSPQDNANAAWGILGNKRGFQHMTVRPISGKGNKFFTAEVLT